MPVVVVNIPQLAQAVVLHAPVHWSVQYGASTYVVPLRPKGEQVMPKLGLVAPNCNEPLEPALAVVKLWSYNMTGNGSGMEVRQSSQ